MFQIHKNKLYIWDSSLAIVVDLHNNKLYNHDKIHNNTLVTHLGNPHE